MRHHEPWTIIGRKTPGGVTFYYYRARTPDGKRTSAISTGEKTKSAARELCRKLEREGKLIPDRNAPEPSKPLTVSDLAKDFWSWGTNGLDGSEYVRTRLKFSDPKKPAISAHYCDGMARQVELHILPSFKRRHVADITPQEIEAFSLRLRDEKGLSGKSVNNVVSAMRTMLAEAYRAGILPWDPGQRRKIRALGHARKERGRLTFDEVQRLFADKALATAWNGHTLYRTINFLAAATGLRQGEILALRDQDVLPDHLHVAHSYDPHYGLMPTKTRKERDVPVPPKVYAAMKPFLGTGGYVFSQNGGETPCTGNLVTEALYAALESIGVTDREQRNVTFHGWRHFLNSTLRARAVPDSVVKRITGHTTQEMQDQYTEYLPEDFASVSAIQREVFK
jgi:integrase